MSNCVCIHPYYRTDSIIWKGLQPMFTFMIFCIFCVIVCGACKILTSAVFWKILGWCFVLGCIFCLIGALL